MTALVPIKIVEEDKLQDQWYQEAQKQTLDTLPEFVRSLVTDYHHDYGTICHAMAAAALAAAHAVNNDSEQGGITGFQAGAVKWEFLQEWDHSRGTPQRLIIYDTILYPQYEKDFTTISKSTWNWVQEEARKRLENGHLGDSVRVHLQSIVDGTVPFGLTVSDKE